MRQYFKKFMRSVGGLEATAELLGRSTASIAAFSAGYRKVSPALAMQIEILTCGKFKKERFIWPCPEDEETTIIAKPARFRQNPKDSAGETGERP